jgi:hypothetical protein
LDSRPVYSNDVDSVWDKEISERVRSVDTGTAAGVNYDEEGFLLRGYGLCFWVVFLFIILRVLR